jgi:hypothetical protein
MISELNQLCIESKEPTKTGNIPKNVLNKMEKHGALIEKVKGENLVSVTNVNYGDSAWKVYEEWAENITNDPRVFIGFFPRGAVLGSTLSPSRAVGANIVVEAISILLHYSEKIAEDFENNIIPEIPPPVEDIPMFVNVRHPKIALSALMQRIQSPPANYPVLCSLKQGSYICTIDQQWANAGINITLFKP